MRKKLGLRHWFSVLAAIVALCHASSSHANKPTADCQAALIGKEWIAATKFIEMSRAELFEKILARIAELKASGRQAVVVFDLDATLFDVRYRNKTTFRAWGKSLESVQYPAIRKALTSLSLENTGHYPEDTLAMLGFDLNDPHVAKAIAALNPYWRYRFSSADNLANDFPYSGAYEFVNAVYNAGAHIVYLTARPAETMLAATIDKLRYSGFPVDPSRVTTIFKPNKSMDTIVFKNESLDQISEIGEVVAFYDNEPGNVVSAWKKFKKAFIVFVDTLVSDRKAVPVDGIYRITGY